MSLAEQFASLVALESLKNMTDNRQLEVADEIEKTLESMGIQVQPRFDIPLSTRIGFMQLKGDLSLE